MNVLKGISGCLLLPFAALWKFINESLELGELVWNTILGRDDDG